MAKKDNSILGKIKAMEQKALKTPKEPREVYLAPVKHLQRDFFIVDLLDTISFQDDLASMEHPLFALKAGDTRPIHYQHNNIAIDIVPHQILGRATIHDKDIWIYCISKLMQAQYEGEEISRTVRFTIYDYLITTNRTTSGRDYERTKDALDRLRSTGITTNIETANQREARGFGLVDSWRIVEEKDGRMVRVEVTLPEWLFRSIQAKNVLTISPDYFRLRKPLDRRIYEIARKHCGQQGKWDVFIDVLYKKSGSTAPLRNFRIAVKSLVEADALPEYHAYYDFRTDKVFFKNRENQLNIKGI